MSDVLLTGATSGLGRWLAPRLGQAGLTVLVHGRDEAKVERGVAEVEAAGGRAEGFVADLARRADVDRLAAEVRDRPLTHLVNNAGVGFGERGGARELSADGEELRWAVNLLAPVRLTRALLPTLRANAPARIVNVGSLGQEPIDFDDLQLAARYDGVRAYRRSKLALAAWTFALADELAGTGVTANCLHPATFMDTEMVRQYGQRPFSTVDEGGAATLRLILEETGSGEFFDGHRAAAPHPDARDLGVQARLRAVVPGF
ncbi:SDR family NAD(P)-dependent oxidoreductase [Dactylosporangium matsuzakiense]|uniref:3-oxoacyl-ACP reductase n=1 Tax=Dactylosporangium matsuzakiense TaxID=53360 RepID=A0A9W6NRQ9_9ACTN|nr:SDR family NAD(P)-dependent oxidoreductase [Dactylosporangium matsuzakiense]UWZ46962.1 SDR family NAD(P)-dependent oxidoreductase [Dactylosporangium matsuzakiense]GLL06854.1 3-oxoacyl-ACP reductase [Dactylosporangium matsuzakiense]